jgi:hypothetical protein
MYVSKFFLKAQNIKYQLILRVGYAHSDPDFCTTLVSSKLVL